MLKILDMTVQWIARILLVIIVVLVFVASIARWVGNPIPWSVDMAQLLFVWICFLGADQALRRDGHIGMDLFVRSLPERARIVIDGAITLLALALMLALVKLGIDLTRLNAERIFSDSSISYAYVTVAVPVGGAILSLSLVRTFYRCVRTFAGAGNRTGGRQ